MSQISPPIRILLIGVVALMAAWFTVLKPGGAEESAAPAAAPAPAGNVNTGAPAVTNAGTQVQTAQGAAQAAADASAAHAGEAGGVTATAPGTAPATTQSPAGEAAPAAPADSETVKEAGLPKSVAKAIAQNKVLVMLFWNSKAADDRAVRKALRAIDRHKGKVKVHVASITDVARYAPITRGVKLAQSPTVVIVDRKLRADALVGYYDRVSIDQAVSDAIRAR